MKPFNYPFKSAHATAKKMRQLRAKTEETALSELNPNSESDRRELVRQIDWGKFDEIIDQLEFCQKQKMKYKD